MTDCIFPSWVRVCGCGLVAVLVAGFAGAAEPVQAEGVTNIGDRLELFVDDCMLERLDGAELVMHRPERRSLVGYPVGSSYSTVIWDGGLYRLYYRLNDIVHYAESADGITWQEPELGIVEGHEGRLNAIFSERPFAHNFVPFLDTRPGVPADERFKAIAGSRRAPEGAEGLYAFASADGIHWRKLSEEPVLRHNPEVHNWHAFDSQNIAFWSTIEQQYVLYFRHWNARPGKMRTIGRAVSSDFIHWTDESDHFEVPNLRDIREHLYTSQVSPYFRAPHIYIALPTRYIYGKIKGESVLGDDGKMRNEGSTDIMLMSTRAGSNRFDRTFKESFIRPGLNPDGWANRANYVAVNVVPTGPDEISIYHKNGDRYVLRTDGFASLHAGYERGEAVTQPLIFSGSELVLNVSTSVGGQVQVEIQDADGNPLPGLTLKSCDPIVDDAIERVVSWGKETDLSRYAGTPVRIRFVLRDADIFSFRFR